MGSKTFIWRLNAGIVVLVNYYKGYQFSTQNIMEYGELYVIT